jgi:c-di-GMP-binding flagellar brake protein YcgR
VHRTVKETTLLVNIPWSRRQQLPETGEQIVIEQAYSLVDQSSSRLLATVNHVGFRSLTASGVIDDDLPVIRTNVVASFLRDQQLYTFDSVIERYGRSNGETTVVLQRPKRVVKVQRRFSYRVPVQTRTTFRISGAFSQQSEPLTGKIGNISEGGLLLITDESLRHGAVVAIHIPSGTDGETMEVTAEVIDFVRDDLMNPHTSVVRLRFDGSNGVGLTNDQREQLVRYLFEQQRLMLQARRLLNTAKKRA